MAPAPPAFISQMAKPKKTEGELDTSKLRGLRDAGHRLVEIDRQITETDKELSRLKEAKNTLISKTIPDLFDEAGTDNVGLPDDAMDLVMSPYYKANISSDWDEERRTKAFDWLTENNFGSIISSTVSLAFSKEDYAAAQAFVEQCEFMQKEFDEGRSNLGPIPTPILELSVKWNTLTALIKEQTEKGVSLPLDVLGATVGRVAKLKKRK